MSGLDMIGFTIAVMAALECVAGRLAQLDRRRHRGTVVAAYLAAAIVCILAASLTWQGMRVGVLDLLSLAVAGYLVLTWDDWRDGAPKDAERNAGYPRGAMPSRIDGGDRPM